MDVLTKSARRRASAGVARSDIVVDYILVHEVERERCRTRLAVVRAGTFEHHAPGSDGIGGIISRRFLKYGRDAHDRRRIRRLRLVTPPA